MKLTLSLLTLIFAAALSACSPQPPLPTPGASPFVPYITPVTPSATAIPTLTLVPAATFLPSITAAPPGVPSEAPTQPIGGMPPGITPGAVSGPYAFILVMPDDVLNIRSAPGADNRLVGTMAYNETGVTRVGASARVGDSIWWEIQSQGGVRGWVNANYLTEYVAPATVCDPAALTLLDDFERAIVNADGVLLASLVSPRHGLDVWAYRSGVPINFDAEHARWVFDSAYVHQWGAHPASGLDVQGAFHDAVLPNLLDVYEDGHEVHCNERGVPGWNISAWPEQYTNLTVYKIYKPPTTGVDLDYRIWLAGIEYVGGKPYLFALIHFIWTP